MTNNEMINTAVDTAVVGLRTTGSGFWRSNSALRTFEVVVQREIPNAELSNEPDKKWDDLSAWLKDTLEDIIQNGDTLKPFSEYPLTVMDGLEIRGERCELTGVSVNFASESSAENTNDNTTIFRFEFSVSVVFNGIPAYFEHNRVLGTDFVLDELV